MPIVWLTDSTLVVPELDDDFLRSIPRFKQGYIDMYPRMRFGGRIVCASAVRYRSGGASAAADTDSRAALLFSGGVDAFASLIAHMDERPELVTLHGADIGLSDTEGWERVRSHTEQTAHRYGLGCRFVHTDFRTFIDERALNALVRDSGEKYWYGFQSGIGIIGHYAPIAYAAGTELLYIASSVNAADNGSEPCASDLSIDGQVRFCGCRVIHDGYEFTRQDKVRRIVEYSRAGGSAVNLRVCWQSTGGGNCCRCEKCYRTMFELFAEGADPRDYGLLYTQRDIARSEIRLRTNRAFYDPYYWPGLRDHLFSNPAAVIPDGAAWLERCDLTRRPKSPAFVIYGLCRHVGRKLRRIARRLGIR